MCYLICVVMGSRRKHYGREASQEFGTHLTNWRKNAKLKLKEAAYLLGLGGKSPGCYLSQIEHGRKPIPEAALLNVPRVYNVPAEEVLRRAYWPQLCLSLLTAIMEPTALPRGIEDYLEELERELEEQEKRELTRYAAFLVLRRRITAEQQKV